MNPRCNRHFGERDARCADAPSACQAGDRRRPLNISCVRDTNSLPSYEDGKSTDREEC